MFSVQVINWKHERLECMQGRPSAMMDVWKEAMDQELLMLSAVGPYSKLYLNAKQASLALQELDGLRDHVKGEQALRELKEVQRYLRKVIDTPGRLLLFEGD